jgi:pseudaminic acid synthase
MMLDDQPIGSGCPPYVIAEMSGNHNQSLDRALAIVEAAAECGVNALKLQTYRPETMTLDVSTGEFVVGDSASLWSGRSLYELYEEAQTPWEWHEPIFRRCRELGITAFSTPFDSSAVDFLEELNCPLYKVSSFENTDLALIQRIARTQKPVIMSTGMATVGEIDTAVNAIRDEGNNYIVLLKCTSSYPSSPEHSNVATIPHMAELFGCEVGLSDHTLGIGAAIAAIAVGASVIEKHFTLSRAEGGVDSAFSMEPSEMKSLVEESRRARQSLGEVSYGPTEGDEKSLSFRRSIYVAEPIRKDELLTTENIRVVRPGLGLAPNRLDDVLGRVAACDLQKGTPLRWEHVGGVRRKVD